ncbi:hypothetical protein FC99_GL002235 [Levilactobacillus koreensis JCM 16448]|uniref:Uncharacterized protein n=1 Tax=Levilactobacillus koreensis TaxID=637971 RepID=A0AAC8UWD2_9LACO|nr:hypothetical protein [Levilactobacillus koreensis]AKP65660.1 hypothetical protein ABN16_12045 [Levilactobacillus koreensis]KRK85752.1 hypothetical protein FC99_GL002235 [Levilactobacillus koreensis JCM 16448]
MTKGLIFAFHGGPTAFVNRVNSVIGQLDDVDLDLLERLCEWSKDNGSVIPMGSLELTAENVQFRLEKLEKLELIDFGVRV